MEFVDWTERSEPANHDHKQRKKHPVDPGVKPRNIPAPHLVRISIATSIDEPNDLVFCYNHFGKAHLFDSNPIVARFENNINIFWSASTGAIWSVTLKRMVGDLDRPTTMENYLKSLNRGNQEMTDILNLHD